MQKMFNEGKGKAVNLIKNTFYFLLLIALPNIASAEVYQLTGSLVYYDGINVGASGNFDLKLGTNAPINAFGVDVVDVEGTYLDATIDLENGLNTTFWSNTPKLYNTANILDNFGVAFNLAANSAPWVNSTTESANIYFSSLYLSEIGYGDFNTNAYYIADNVVLSDVTGQYQLTSSSNTLPSVSAVPEPSSMALLIIGVFALWFRKRFQLN